MTGITIRGTGRFLPERIVTNEDFMGIIETSDEWIVSHTGIRRRRIAGNETTCHMASKAAQQALEAAGMDAQDIDMIIGTTVTGDYAYPSMACLVQESIGNENAFAFDIAAACAGFSFALDMARRYLAAGDIRNILIVSSEMLSQTIDFDDRGSCILFGDGAGAVVVSSADKMFASYQHSDASGSKSLYLRHKRRHLPFFDAAPDYSMDPFKPESFGMTWMDGHEVYRFATKAMPIAVRAACEKAGITPDDLDLIIPHQANLRIIKTAARNLKIPMDKVYVNIHEYSNTSSATIPICIDECIRTGRLKRGDKFCVVGFGSGLVNGACVLEY